MVLELHHLKLFSDSLIAIILQLTKRVRTTKQ